MSNELLADRIWSDQLHNRQHSVVALTLPVSQNDFYHFVLRRRDLGGGGIDLQRRDEGGNAVVEVVEAFEVIDNALIGSERAGRERLRARLIDLEQTPVAERALGRERFPRGLIEQRES